MKHPKFWARFFLVASIVSAGIIFWFSAQKGVDSQAMSDPLTLHVAKILRRDYTSMPEADQRSYLEMLSKIIRKNGHFCEFALLGFNLMGTMHFFYPALTDGNRRLRAMVIAALYAASDELHQLFVSERSAQVLDVLIDSAGSLAGTLFFTLCLAMLVKLARRQSKSASD